jgi:hypothetical protein
MTISAIIFGATGRLGKLMCQSLDELHIPTLRITRAILSNYLETRALPALKTHRILLIDASIDYTSIIHLRRHEAEKHDLMSTIARHHEIELIASFSSGATDFDDGLINNMFYKEYKQIKQENLVFFQSLNTRVFYPKIYTLIGRFSHAIKSTGWVDVFEQARTMNEVSIAHPYEPRSWIAENTVQRLFINFVTGTQTEYLTAPVCGTFQLADIVSFFEQHRDCSLEIKKHQTTPWLKVPYVAPNPVQVCTHTLHDELKLQIRCAMQMG